MISRELPDSARWDIHRGDIDPRLLQLMVQIADRSPIGVVTLASGHPFNIFGTNRQSAHTLGSAVDLYGVDGELVVRQRREGTPASELSRWLLDRVA